MLTTYLNNLPYSRFVLIEDTLEQRAENILKYIIDCHLKNLTCKIHYFAFDCTSKISKKISEHPNVVCYNFGNDLNGWLASANKSDLGTVLSRINKTGSIFVIDSLSHAICQYHHVTIYKILQRLLLNKDVLRILTVLHLDMLENLTRISQCFQHLSTLALTLEPKFNSESGRVSYTYRKTSGKIIKQIEEYRIENGILKTEAIKKIDPKILVQENLNQVLPENLTTFKISLGDKDKESRSTLVLPYLPKESGAEGENASESKIFYQFDNVDDWDEEDPDDDLDI